MVGRKNPNWKGIKVGYTALHNWIRRRLSKPLTCSLCHKTSSVDLANISGQYKRNLSDWEWLCRRCHMIKDGRLKKLIKTKKNVKKGVCHYRWKGGRPNCIICDMKISYGAKRCKEHYE